MTFRASLASLSSAQKPRRGVPAYTLFLNRPVGRVLAAAANELRLSPNHVTSISALLTACGLLVLTLRPPTVLTSVLVAGLLATGYAFDSADGQLARLQATGAPAGEWFDHVVDCAKTVAVHACVLVATYRFLDVPPALLLVPLAFQLAAVVLFFSTTLTDQLLRQGPSSEPAAVHRARPFLMLPVDYGVLCLTMAWFGRGPVFWWVYSALCVATVAFTLMYLVVSYRRVRATTSPSVAPVDLEPV